jgi:ADP-ribosylglycohydrolase
MSAIDDPTENSHVTNSPVILAAENGMPASYLERVYAGVLGKIIGVYLGRPFENWAHERISAELGEINYFVNHRFGLPLILTDDDISGTFTFLRAVGDHGYSQDLTPAQIGLTWMNYIVEGRTVLWWGGVGNSTEHTAYARMKQGIEPPASGSQQLNGSVVAQQIGAQIFIDGWAMVAPGDPEFAAELARRAASVSHDGEAIVAAQVVAAMESQAFTEPSIDRLLDVATELIPRDSVIYRLIADVRDWREKDGDWRLTRQRIAENYGYDRFGGVCPVVPNHGLIILALLYGNDDFQQSLMIVNTSGWDTDCNSGNLGCLLGIKNGLKGIDAGPDWRGPIADRLYLSTADGGRAITDAATEAIHIANTYCHLHHAQPLAPKAGARFHFELPGAVQGFRLDEGSESWGVATLENVAGHSELGTRSLALHFQHLAAGRIARASTPTFIPPEARELPSYELMASPTLYPGQHVACRVSAGSNAGPVVCRLFLRVYNARDELTLVAGPPVRLPSGAARELSWIVPPTDGQPIAEIGLEVSSAGATAGCVYLDYLTWDGEPNTVLTRPGDGGTMWRRAWVNAVDRFDPQWPEPYRISQNTGTGLLIQGTAEWKDYAVQACITPHMTRRAGLAARVQGLRRYYALVLDRDQMVILVKARDDVKVLDCRTFHWDFDATYTLKLEVAGNLLRGWVDDVLLFDVEDPNDALEGGGVALVCGEGTLSCDGVQIEPLATP